MNSTPSPNTVPILNWREIAHLSVLLRQELTDSFVERVFVRQHPERAEGYLKSEWVIQLSSRKSERAFVFSVRSRAPYFAMPSAKSTRPSPLATRSPFDLALAKHLKGARLISIETPPRERALLFWFGSPGAGSRIGLVILLIPAMPEAILIEGLAAPWKVIARSRTQTIPAGETYQPPDGLRAPMNPEIRAEWVRDLDRWTDVVESALRREAYHHRLLTARREIRELLKQATEREKQSLQAAANAEKEDDWQLYGDLLKSALSEPPPLKDGKRAVTDFETGKSVSIPCDPKLSLKGQVEKFYQFAKRKNRRLEEARARAQNFGQARARLAGLLGPPESGDLSATQPDWDHLTRLESEAGLEPLSPETKPGAKKPKRGSAWLGKSFVSRDGLKILVGRSRDENLELTFKHARGNDLWMHVRGKPGAHLVIPLSPGKSAPLETLLDAAQLCLWYSGGEKWGKTEVDYVFKKYVKRIKDSTEASYTRNKTLMVAPEPARLKRLLDQAR